MTGLRYILTLILLSVAVFCYAGRYSVIVLGIAQDGGYPHAGCSKECCEQAWQNESMRRYVTALALTDSAEGKWWLFEATPDIKEQLHYFRQLTAGKYRYLPDGIFLTHAHIGHYAGLMQLGREVLGANGVPVYTLPRMRSYLEQNGPWSQLVSLGNISLQNMPCRKTMNDRETLLKLSEQSGVFAFTVPHRDEYSETAGYGIEAGGRKYVFIPDINKWQLWEHELASVTEQADVVLVDGTFYRDGELKGRSMAEVPHPFISETMSLFEGQNAHLAARIWFIHFNHTNPLLWDDDACKHVREAGFNIAAQGEKL